VCWNINISPAFSWLMAWSAFSWHPRQGTLKAEAGRVLLDVNDAEPVSLAFDPNTGHAMIM
jgi:hypothetical protein